MTQRKPAPIKWRAPPMYPIQAQNLASLLHRGHFRRDDTTPALNHLAHVATLVSRFLRILKLVDQEAMDDLDLNSDRMICAAWLHDCLEDIPELSGADLLNEHGVPEDVVNLVSVLSHLSGYSYEGYIDSIIRFGPEAIVIKFLDILDNLSDDPGPSARENYVEALPRLLDAFTEALEGSC